MRTWANDDLPGHVIAAFLELDHGAAAVAALPALLLGFFDQSVCFLIFGAVSPHVPFAIAEDAYFRPAALTFAVFTAALGVNL